MARNYAWQKGASDAQKRRVSDEGSTLKNARLRNDWVPSQVSRPLHKQLKTSTNAVWEWECLPWDNAYLVTTRTCPSVAISYHYNRGICNLKSYQTIHKGNIIQLIDGVRSHNKRWARCIFICHIKKWFAWSHEECSGILRPIRDTHRYLTVLTPIYLFST